MMLYKKGVLTNFSKFTGKDLRQMLFLNKVIKKELLPQVFSCEFWEIFKNTEHPRMSASASYQLIYYHFLNRTLNMKLSDFYCQSNYRAAGYFHSSNLSVTSNYSARPRALLKKSQLLASAIFCISPKECP